MNDKFTNTSEHDNDALGRKLSQIAEQTHANGQFAAELEEKLRDAHRPKTGWFTAFTHISPTLRWVALMVVLALVLSWSIRSLIPAPQPANDNTPVAPEIPASTPSPNVLPDESATPSAQENGYDFRGAKLFLQAPLPDSPETAHVYLLNKDQPATLEQARAFAERFGIRGETYTGPNYVFNTTDYVFSDGKQSLSVYSERYFSYSADMAKVRHDPRGTRHDNAEAIVHEFLQARGMDFPFSISASDFFGGYVVEPLTPDSIPVQYESFTYPAMRVTLDENGEVLNIAASLMSFDSTPLGEYGIITAQEALDILVDDYALAGKMEFMHSATEWPKEWYRTYPDNQPVTLYGSLTSNPAVEAGKPALLTIDGIPLTGDTSGMENLGSNSFIKVNGQFLEENGIRRFNVQFWDRKIIPSESWISGTLSRQGEQIILTSDDGSGTQYPLLDPPADLPVESATNGIGVSGVIENGALNWYYIQFFENSSSGGGGGGGGGGFGFYKLNLTGTPVPFPDAPEQPQTNTGTTEHIVQEDETLASIAANYSISVRELAEANGIQNNTISVGQTLLIPAAASESPRTGLYTVQEGDTLSAIAEKFATTVDDLLQLNGLSDPAIYVGQSLTVPVPEPKEQPVEDLRGYLSIAEHGKLDGTTVKEYSLNVVEETGTTTYTLEGQLLSELDSYNALPIDVTGMIDMSGKLIVESYKIPYPDLQFQILTGTQRSEQIEGQTVIVFTTEDGSSYVEFMATNSFPTDAFTGYQGDLIQQEALIIPGETFGGMPVAHIFQTSIFQEGAPEMQVVADKIFVYSDKDIPGFPNDYAPPNLTIELVELVYYVTNPYYQTNDPNYDQRSPYIQPVWHFQGRYDNGGEFDILIQALKKEFLLPELSPGIGPG